MLKLFKSPETVIKYLAAALILIIPLYPKFPFIRIPGVQVSIRLEDFLLAITAIFLGFYLLPRIRKIFSFKIEKAILVYLLMGFTSLLYAFYLTKTVEPSVGLLHWVRRIEYFVPFFLGVLAVKAKGNLEFCIKVLMVDLAVIILYGMGQRFLSWPIIITQNIEYSKGIALRWIQGSHVNSTFAGHYDLATFLVFILPTLISLIVVLKDIKLKVILAVLSFGGLWLLSAAVSRISIVSFLLGTAVALLILRKYRAILVVLMLSVIYFSFSSDLSARYRSVIEEVQKRLQAQTQLRGTVRLEVFAQDGDVTEPRRIERETPTPTPLPVIEDRSSSIRLNVEWPRAIRALTKNPLLGTGYSSITLATDNDYLRALGEVGVLGFVAFSLIFLRLIKLLLSELKKLDARDDIQRCFVAGITGGLLGVLANAAFIDVFEASKFAIIFWLFMGFLVGLLRKKDYAG